MIRAFTLSLLLTSVSPQWSASAETSFLELAIDEPVHARIAGYSLKLGLVSGSVDQITLNESAVNRLDMPAARRSTRADARLDGAKVFRGRSAGGWLDVAGQQQEQPFFWFPGAPPLPLDGTIGLMAFPHQRILLRFRSGEAAVALRLPLVGDVDRTAYGMIVNEGLSIAIAVEPTVRRRLPLVSLSSETALIGVLAGQLEGEPWEEETMFGQRQMVRRLVLAQPLKFGLLRFPAVAVRIPAYAKSKAHLRSLSSITPKTSAAVVVTLSRSQLDEQVCTSLSVDKQEMEFLLRCGGLETENDVDVTEPTRVPVADADLSPSSITGKTGAAYSNRPIVMALPASNGWLELQADEALPATIRGQPIQLSLRSGALGNVWLNEASARRIGVSREANAFPITYGGREISIAVGVDARISIAGVEAIRRVSWLPGINNERWSGSIEMRAIPHDRIRIWLQKETPIKQPLRLPIWDRDRSSSAAAVVSLPGIDRLYFVASIRERWRLPIASLSLAVDLSQKYGGKLQGPVWHEVLRFGIRRTVRRLVLSRPLIIGPLHLHEIAVEVGSAIDSGNRLARGQQPLIDADLNAEDIVVRGRTAVSNSAGRWLRLSRAQLDEHHCISLSIDKPNHIWQLDCQGRN